MRAACCPGEHNDLPICRLITWYYHYCCCCCENYHDYYYYYLYDVDNGKGFARVADMHVQAKLQANVCPTDRTRYTWQIRTSSAANGSVCSAKTECRSTAALQGHDRDVAAQGE